MGVVADGMGGRTGGRKASDQVLMTARQLFDHYAPESDDAPQLLRQMGLQAHLVIKLTAIAAEQEPHSTMAAFLVQPGGQCHWVHTGDSRLYHFRGNTLMRRTKDQSFVQSLPPRDASQFLVEKARSRAMGHGDNLSLAIVKIEPLADGKPAGATATAAAATTRH
jgi:serine/threonine protein phosphatase PrpC